MIRLFIIGLFAVLAFLAGSYLSPIDKQETVQQSVSNPVESELVQKLSARDTGVQVYTAANPAVVFISTQTIVSDPFDWFPEKKAQKGSGSGIIVDSEEGIIVTNLHVISNARSIEIILADGLKYPAKLLGFDQEYDIAVLKLKTPPKSITSIPFGDSDNLEIGQPVFAIGNPFGLNRTLTAGIISSLDRTLKTPEGNLLKDLIQTDAAINPGNSGGPLIDTAGKLIGVNTVILSQSGDSAGIGFAIPINKIKKILPELIATGKVLRPYLGWILIDSNQGPLVRRVMNAGPADTAGLQPLERFVRKGGLTGVLKDYESTDLITAVNKIPVRSKLDVDSILEELKSGEEVELTLKKGGVYGPERVVKITPKWK